MKYVVMLNVQHQQKWYPDPKIAIYKEIRDGGGRQILRQQSSLELSSYPHLPWQDEPEGADVLDVLLPSRYTFTSLFYGIESITPSIYHIVDHIEPVQSWA